MRLLSGNHAGLDSQVACSNEFLVVRLVKMNRLEEPVNLREKVCSSE
jgi:hypothetical protein